MILNALLAKYDGDIQMAKANVEIFLENAVGVGEHNDVIQTIDLEIAKIATAEDNIAVLHKYLKVSAPRI